MKQNQPKILIVDDNRDIHLDFKKVLVADSSPNDLSDMEAALFDDAPATRQNNVSYILESAYQGEQAIRLVENAVMSGQPYGLAFVDVRMPPGIDGVQTIAAIRKIDPNLACIICTASCDYTPQSASEKIGISEGILFVTKPFEPEVIRELASAMLRRIKAAHAA